MSIGSRYNQHSFAMVPRSHSTRSKFDRSHAVKDTMQFDKLVPLFVEEVYPDYTINLSVKTFMRLAPQVKPIMDNMYVDFFFFFVPHRLVWTNFEKFMGFQENPGDSTDFTMPQITAPTGGWPNGSIADHFGIPTQIAGITVSALPFRSLALIRNEWFRDQNTQLSLQVPKGNGPDSPSIPAYAALYDFSRRHDYFSSALPFTQKGPAVTMPLGSTAPVVGTGEAMGLDNGPNNAGMSLNGSSTELRLYTSLYSTAVGTSPGAAPALSNPGAVGITTNPADSGLVALLNQAIGAPINEFRTAIMLQSFYEKDARGGTRYTEVVKMHFNVDVPDYRLQRPEFLGSGTMRINQHPVAQTSETTDTASPQGNLAAFSTFSESGNRIGFSKSFVEHGTVIGIVRARSENSYQQGLNKMWSRKTRLDMFWPTFQQLGEQPILNKELYCQGPSVVDGQGNIIDDLPFGYQERYAELRYRPSEIRGQFRSNFAQSLDVWHQAQEFANLPTLQNLIYQDSPIERALVVTREDYPHLLCDYWFDYTLVAPLVTYSVPAALGRF